MNILDELKQAFKQGDALTRLIFINVALFVLISIVEVIEMLFQINISGNYLDWLMIPAHIPTFLSRPWTALTYMFLHVRFMHLLFNVLWLYWMGRIFIDMLNGRRLFVTYILGGLSGAALYILLYNILPAFAPSEFDPSFMLGASASVMAIGIATATYFPNYEIQLLLIGNLKLKYLALALVLMDLVFMADGNAGGHIAHLGGALYGFLWASNLKQGRDISKWFSQFLDFLIGIFKPKPKIKVAYKSSNYSYSAPSQTKASNQREIDAILDKIAKSGYDSLSKDEKETLFKMSNKS